MNQPNNSEEINPIQIIIGAPRFTRFIQDILGLKYTDNNISEDAFIINEYYRPRLLEALLQLDITPIFMDRLNNIFTNKCFEDRVSAFTVVDITEEDNKKLKLLLNIYK